MLKRLIEPASELAMSEWVRRSALCDILKTDFSALNEDWLYRNMDELYPKRAQIEAGLCRREKSLFSLKENILLYDLTSTYFEGLCLANPKAQRGYSRDSRPECKQVLIGLVLDAEGFPKAHEVFAGNRPDTTTVDEMLGVIEQRMANKAQATVVVDRGMASAENLSPRFAHAAITGWWRVISPRGPTILSNSKKRKAGRRSCAKLPPAILARRRCVCWSSRPRAPMARRPWPCAGARDAPSKTGQSEREHRHVS